MGDFIGTTGDDFRASRNHDDHFDYSQGGEDTLAGGAGQDVFYMGGALDAGDRLDGGAGYDTLELNGDYSAGLTLDGTVMTSIEKMTLDYGGQYRIVIEDSAVNPVYWFNIEVDTAATVDASAVSSTFLQFQVDRGGGMNLRAGAMDDHFELTDVPARSDRFDGGGGDHDSLLLEYGGDFHAAAHSFQNIEEIQVYDDVHLMLNDGNTAAGQTLLVTSFARAGLSAAVDGHKELDSHLHMTGGEGDVAFRGGHLGDLIEGGSGRDVLEGGHGADTLSGGRGGDVFIYRTAGDSTRHGFDLITDLKDNDRIDLSHIDADDSQGGDQAFTRVDAFSGHAGELTFSYQADGGYTVLAGDIDGDGKAELVIHLAGDHSGFAGLVL